MAALSFRLPALPFPPSRVAAALRRTDDPAPVPGRPSGDRDAAPSPGTMTEAVPLTRLAMGATGRVVGVRLAEPAGSGAAAGLAPDPALERMALRLIEIGFVEGESLRVVAFGQPGNDPIGVRIGGRGGLTTFALRRQEASCVWVVPDDASRLRAA